MEASIPGLSFIPYFSKGIGNIWKNTHRKHIRSAPAGLWQACGRLKVSSYSNLSGHIFTPAFL